MARRYLKELGVQYEPVSMDMSKKEHKADWYTKVRRFLCCKQKDTCVLMSTHAYCRLSAACGR